MSVPVIIGLMILACFLIYFLFIEILKYLSGNDNDMVKEDKEVITIKNLELPTPIEKMTEFLISSIVRKVYSVFVKFEYHKMSEDELLEKQWHTWQVSMLFMLYKYDQEFYIANKEQVFHKSIYELDLKSLESLVHDLIIKYQNNVMISKSKDDHCKDILWSIRDVSLLFYFLSKYREI